MKGTIINSKIKILIGILIIIVLVSGWYMFKVYKNDNKIPNHCIEIEDMNCNYSFSDSFILRYNQNGSSHSGGNWGGAYFKGIVLESEKCILKGSIMEFSHTGGGAMGEEEVRHYYDIPHDFSTIKVDFTIKCYSIGNKTTKRIYGAIEYGNISIDIFGWRGLDIIYDCE